MLSSDVEQVLRRPTLADSDVQQLVALRDRTILKQLIAHPDCLPERLVATAGSGAIPEEAVRQLVAVWEDAPAEFFDRVLARGADPNARAYYLRIVAAAPAVLPASVLDELLATNRVEIYATLAVRRDLPEAVLERLARDRRKSVRSSVFQCQSDPTIIRQCWERSQALNDIETAEIFLITNESWAPRLHQGSSLPTPRNVALELLAAQIASVAATGPDALNAVLTFIERTSPVGLHAFLDRCDEASSPRALLAALGHPGISADAVCRLSYWPDPSVATRASEHPLAPADAALRIAREAEQLLGVALSRSTWAELLPQLEGEDRARVLAVLREHTTEQPTPTAAAVTTDDPLHELLSATDTPSL